MNLINIAAIASFGLFAGMLVAFEAGRRLGVGQLGKEPESARIASGLLDGAVFGLLGLLVAFTFSGAASRFDQRRDLVIDEANAIGTAYLRLAMLPPEMQPALRDLFRRYLDKRIETYRMLPDLDASRSALSQANELQTRIWSAAVEASQAAKSIAAATLLLDAMNEMFDIASRRTVTGFEMHPPMIIFVMLFVLALLSSILAGHAMAGSSSRNWVHLVGFAAIIAGTVFMILDIEYPRLGMIRVDSVDKILLDMRRSMD